jgi:hypothetical protein
MRWLLPIVFVLAVSAMAAAATDAPVSLTVSLDPPEIPFHRQAQYTVTVEAPADADVKMPDMLDKFGGVPVSDLRRDTKAVKGGRKRIIETYFLDPIFAANYRIYPAEISWGNTGEKIEVPSPALRVRDLTEEEKKLASEFADIGGPVVVHTPLARDWRLWVVVGALAALGVGAAAYMIVRRRGKAGAVAPPPPWEVAYGRLRELDQRQLPQAAKFEAYYVDLSAILRYYIEDAFRLHAPEQTTPEFLSAASTSGALTVEHQRLLASFLRHCDLVKFAQYTPTIPEMERAFATVLQFVDETVPKPETPIGESAPATQEVA